MNLLTDGLNYFAGYGVRLALITPSMEELIKTYEVHHNFWRAARCRSSLACTMPGWRRFLASGWGWRRYGKRGGCGRGSYTETVQEPLLSPTALMNLPEDRALVIVGRHKVLARKTYYKDTALWAARSQL